MQAMATIDGRLSVPGELSLPKEAAGGGTKMESIFVLGKGVEWREMLLDGKGSGMEV